MFKTLKVAPQQKAQACIIWLHGLGADGADFVNVPVALGLPPDLPILFLFPHAPHQAVTINQGAIMPAWYDIRSFDLEAQQDEPGIRRSEKALRAFMEQVCEQEKLSFSKLLLIGFSQGGALALHTALRYEKPLAGVGALSTYLPLQGTLEKDQTKANQTIPIFWGHGLLDPMVPYGVGKKSADYLKGHGWEVKWHSYSMAHAVCTAELLDLGAWIKKVLFKIG